MKFNTSKFQVVHYRRNRHKSPNLAPYNTLIQSTDDIQDLGIIVSVDALFISRITKLAIKYRHFIGWILRASRTRELVDMLAQSKTLVLIRLDYCSQIWSPNSTGLIEEIEELQRTFTCKITGLWP